MAGFKSYMMKSKKKSGVIVPSSSARRRAARKAESSPGSSSSFSIQLLILTLVAVSVLSVSIIALTNVEVQDRVRNNMKFVEQVWESAHKADSNGGNPATMNLRTAAPNVANEGSNNAIIDTHRSPKPVAPLELQRKDQTPPETSAVVASSSAASTVEVHAMPWKPNPPAKRVPNIHFIHIPKCGGTTMTVVLRQMQCVIDPVKNVDCCTNPGFCDWHAKRRCATIQGCTNHFPNTKNILKPMPSITIMREPISR